VRRVVGEIQKEGLVGFFRGGVNEAYRLAAEFVGEVAFGLNDRAVVFERMQVFVDPLLARLFLPLVGGDIVFREVLMAAAEEAVKVIEPTPVWMEGGAGAEVPLADRAGLVAGLLQDGADQGLVLGNAFVVVFGKSEMERRMIELATEGVRVATGQQGHAAGSAKGMGDVGRTKHGAGGGQLVKRRRLEIFGAVESNVGVTEIVAQDHQDVRAFGGGENGGGTANQAEEEERKEANHRVESIRWAAVGRRQICREISASISGA